MTKNAPPCTVVLCNGADSSGCEGKTVLTLGYLPSRNLSSNISISLSEFTDKVYYLSDRLKDLLEIAAYVYAADRMTRRGQIDSVEYNAWARHFHFIIRVRDFEFWNKSDAKNRMNEALSFMTGDLRYDFTFQPSLPEPRFNLMDKEEFQGFGIDQGGKASIILFSGGRDSLVGSIGRLEQTEGLVCLVGHMSQPSMKKTQDRLCQALDRLYPNRVRHYPFECHLKGVRGVEETQRTRMFLYSSIAYAISHAYSQKTFFVYENGVTALNFPRRQYLINARASRTTHPKTIALLEGLLSEIDGSKITIQMPFIWKTKTDILCILKEFGKERFITSSVSCSKTYQNMSIVTHCGGCYQCIDRRFAIYGAELDDIDDGSLYGTDFITQGVQDRYAITTLIDYLRQAMGFAEH
jgi:hypothetical protein